jgi:predicted MPP superfamily phosphohydrolase
MDYMNKKGKKRTHTGLIIFLLITLLLGFLVYDSNTRITTNNYTLCYDNLPASFNGYRIAQLTDIHAADFGDGYTGLADIVRKARPNIIVITGDLIDCPGDVASVEPLIKKLAGIAPVYYVTGNHEWASGALRELFDMLGGHGVTVLRNEYINLTVGDESIVLAGVDDPNGPKDMKTPEALVSEIRGREGDAFLVLLAHRNNQLDRFAALGVELVFCGHAHGGVIRLPFVGGLIGPSLEWFPDYTSGVYSEGGTMMLVSRGIGNRTGIPRFLNSPQVLVAVLRQNKRCNEQTPTHMMMLSAF